MVAEKTVEGLLGYKRRSQASCICPCEFRVTESMDPLEIGKELTWNMQNAESANTKRCGYT